jgi:ankyrin repeat protein
MRNVFIICFFITQLISAQKNEFLNRAFWKSNPSIEDVNKEIKKGHNPSELNRFGFDALGYALLEKTNNKTLEYLLTLEGNDVNKLTHDGRTYIFWAAYKNNLDFVKHLIDKGAKMDVIDDKGYNVINFAAAIGQQNSKLYDLLIENGVKLNAKTPKGANPILLIAPNLEDLSFLEYFTSKGLSIKDVDNKGNGIFNYATTKENRKILEELIKLGVPHKNLNKINGNAFLFATKRARKGYNSLEFFKYLESLGVNPNMVTKEGETPIHNLSSACKDIATFQYFIDKGVDVNSEYKDGNNALINASYRNDTEVVDFLIKNTKKINHKNKKGVSALSNAVRGNTPETVDLLIKNGRKKE